LHDSTSESKNRNIYARIYTRALIYSGLAVYFFLLSTVSIPLSEHYGVALKIDDDCDLCANTWQFFYALFIDIGTPGVGHMRPVFS